MRFTYGKSNNGNLAVARYTNRTHGVWDAVEVPGDRYHIADYELFTEHEMDRADALEASLEPSGNGDQREVETGAKPTYNLHTEAGRDKLNGTTYSTREAMLEAVRAIYGEACDFGVAEGTILANDELVATFGEGVNQ